jgi:hypothetical protein
MLGPGVGTILFWIGGYNFMIFFFGGSLIFVAISFQFLLPACLDLQTGSGEGQSEEREDDNQVSKMELVKHPNYLFALIAMGVETIALNFYLTLLSLRLIHTFGLSEYVTGLYFLIQPAAAILAGMTITVRI